MTGCASGLRLPSAFLTLLLVLPAIAQSAPAIISPVLAIVNNPDDKAGSSCFVPISITGSGFGLPVSSSKVTVTNTTDSTTGVYFANALSSDELWVDTRIVIKLPCTLSHPRVTVELADGTKSVAVTADRYEYTFSDTNGIGTPAFSAGNPLPLAVTNDGSKGYLLEEFSRDLKRWDLETGMVSKASDDPAHQASLNCNDCFANPLFPSIPLGDPNGNGIPDANEYATYTASGESVIVDGKGRIWFSQGGALLYGGLGGNHSRIVSFDPKIAKTTANPYRIYNVPGANNQVKGLAWDKARQRIWYSSEARHSGGFCRAESIHNTRLVSFDPDTVDAAVYDTNFSFSAAAADMANACEGGTWEWEPDLFGPGLGGSVGTAGTCKDSARACYTADDCVLGDYVCDANATDATDDFCFREHPLLETVLPPPTGEFCFRYYGAAVIGHLAVSSVDDSIWYTSYIGRDPVDEGDLTLGGQLFVGRLDPDAVAPVDRERHFPFYSVPAGAGFVNGPWEIDETANGDMAIILDEDFSVARFNVSRVDDPACLDLASPTTNACIEVRKSPGYTSQNSHSLAEDKEGNIWFSLYGFQAATANSPSIGIWKADRTGPVMFPSFSLFDDAVVQCPNGYPGFSGTGMTINKDNGDVWFADFCRKRIGRLRKAVCDCE